MCVKSFLTDFDVRNKKTFAFLTVVIIVVAAALRLTGLGFSYSNDELSALSRVRFDSFSDLVDKGFYVDGHPGGIQVFLYYWVKLFGMNEWAVRLPFAVGGIIAVYFAIRLFTRWFGETSGLLAGAFLSFLEFPLLYSQIARPYGSGMLFTLLMTWFWTRLLFDEKPSAKIAAAYMISTAACMYNHYFSFLLALIIGFTGLFFLKRNRIVYYLTAGAGAALLFSPHIYITINHLSIGGVGLWLSKPEFNWLPGHIWYIFNESLLMILLALSILVSSLIYAHKNLALTRYHLFSFLFFILPLITGFYYSRWVNPVLQHSVLIFSLPFLIALLFSFSGKLPEKKSGIIVLFVLLAGTLQTVAGNRYYSKQHFGEFRGIAVIIDKWNQQYGEKNITRAISINNPWYLDFYADQTKGGRTTFAQYDNRGGVQLDSLAGILDSCKTDYFMYGWTKPIPQEINDMVMSRFPCVAGYVNFGNLAEATLYCRASNSFRSKSDTLFRVESNSSDSLPVGYQSMKGNEFSQGFEGTTNSLISGKTGKMVASVEVMSDSLPGDAILAISIHDNDGNTLQWLGAKFSLYIRSGKWSNVRQSILITDNKLLDKQMKVYVWNPGKRDFIIRNLAITNEQPFNNDVRR